VAPSQLGIMSSRITGFPRYPLKRLCRRPCQWARAAEEADMVRIHYKIVQHDGGWAYKLDDVFSEPFATHDQALVAARRVAVEQSIPDDTHEIQYQDADGVWHTEIARSDDRPEADVTG
jgi:hypothetical protein